MKRGRGAATLPRERAGLGLVVVVVLVLALLVGGGYAAAYVGARDRIARDTTVAGIAIGGRTPSDAAAALKDGFAARLAAPITVRLGLKSLTISPTEAGLSVDYDASVAHATPHEGWDASGLWDYYTDGTSIAPVVRVRRATLDRLVAKLDGKLGTGARNGHIFFTRSGVSVVQPVAGSKLDVAGLRSGLLTAVLADPGSPDRHVTAQVQQVAPTIDGTDIRRALNRFANPALSGSVALVFGRHPVRLQVRDFRRTLSMRPVDGALVPHVDAEALLALIPANVRRSRPPVPATVTVRDGVPHVVAARPGIRYPAHAVAQAFLTAAAHTGTDRTVTVAGVTQQAGFDGKDAKALGIATDVGSYSMPVAAVQRSTIAADAARLDDALVRPGDGFSFLARTGPASSDGRESPLATAVYDAALAAGLPVTERHAPTTYQPGYPAGRDATVSTGDLRWADNTAYGVLVSVALTADRVSVTLYSTPVWDVSLATSRPESVTRAHGLIQNDAACVPRRARPGFDVSVRRSFTRPGESTVDHTDTVVTHYDPVAAIHCGKPKG